MPHSCLDMINGMGCLEVYIHIGGRMREGKREGGREGGREGRREREKNTTKYNIL